jgi:hypothetical protein
MWWLWSVLAGAEVVDRVIAVVGDDPVLASEVRLEQDLARIDQAPIPLWTCDRPAESIAVDVALVRLLAGEVDLYQPAQEAVVERTLALRYAAGDAWEPLLAEHGLDGAAVQLAVRRRMIVERFLTRALAVDPTDEAGWLEAYDRLLTGLRARVRIRLIPYHGHPPAEIQR